MAISLGIDPGLRNTGWAVVDDQRVVAHGVIRPRGKLSVAATANTCLRALADIVSKFAPSCAVVEEVTWRGIRSATLIPLSHVAGALVGFLVSQGIDTYLLTPAMKVKIRKRAKWSDHEHDAVALVESLRRALNASGAAPTSTPRRRRTTIAARRVRGLPYRKDGGETV